MLVMIDNQDSFVYNLVRYFQELSADVRVFRNDAISISALERLQPEGIVLSPGPGVPEKAGIMMDVIHSFAGKVPLLGVCLGHQALGLAFGARLTYAPQPMHGKVKAVKHDGQGLFSGLPQPLEVTRYHSLVLSEEGWPSTLEVTARNCEGLVMGLRHRLLPIEGVQFHPEAECTVCGHELLQNFLALCRIDPRQG